MIPEFIRVDQGEVPSRGGAVPAADIDGQAASDSTIAFTTALNTPDAPDAQPSQGEASQPAASDVDPVASPSAAPNGNQEASSPSAGVITTAPSEEPLSGNVPPPAPVAPAHTPIVRIDLGALIPDETGVEFEPLPDSVAPLPPPESLVRLLDGRSNVVQPEVDVVVTALTPSDELPSIVPLIPDRQASQDVVVTDEPANVVEPEVVQGERQPEIAAKYVPEVPAVVINELVEGRGDVPVVLPSLLPSPSDFSGVEIRLPVETVQEGFATASDPVTLTEVTVRREVANTIRDQERPEFAISTGVSEPEQKSVELLPLPSLVAELSVPVVTNVQPSVADESSLSVPASDTDDVAVPVTSIAETLEAVDDVVVPVPVTEEAEVETEVSADVPVADENQDSEDQRVVRPVPATQPNENPVPEATRTAPEQVDRSTESFVPGDKQDAVVVTVNETVEPEKRVMPTQAAPVRRAVEARVVRPDATPEHSATRVAPIAPEAVADITEETDRDPGRERQPTKPATPTINPVLRPRSEYDGDAQPTPQNQPATAPVSRPAAQAIAQPLPVEAVERGVPVVVRGENSEPKQTRQDLAPSRAEAVDVPVSIPQPDGAVSLVGPSDSRIEGTTAPNSQTSGPASGSHVESIEAAPAPTVSPRPVATDGFVPQPTTTTSVPESPQPVPVSVDVVSATNVIQRAVSGDGHIHVRLDPPELGAMIVDVTRGDDGVVARLEVTTSAAHRAVSETLGELQQSLARSGVSVDRVEVVLTENRNEGSRQDRGQSSRDGQPSERRQSQGQRQNQEQSRRDEQRRPDESQPDDEFDVKL